MGTLKSRESQYARSLIEASLDPLFTISPEGKITDHNRIEKELSEKQKEYLTAIKQSGDALTVLIDDILDLAKVDSGKMVFEQIPFRLAASISAMIHLFEPKIHEKERQKDTAVSG